MCCAVLHINNFKEDSEMKNYAIRNSGEGKLLFNDKLVSKEELVSLVKSQRISRLTLTTMSNKYLFMVSKILCNDWIVSIYEPEKQRTRLMGLVELDQYLIKLIGKDTAKLTID